MNLSQLQGEDKLLLARLKDLSDICMYKYRTRFTTFLNEKQLLIAEEYARQIKLNNVIFYGGYPGAVRKVAAFLSEYDQEDAIAFPFQAVNIHYKADMKLTHRDFLGSLMALQIKRDSVGDIVIQSGKSTVFALDTVIPTILDELRKVGNVGVRCEIGEADNLTEQQQFIHLKGTVSSTRLDCLISMLTNTSRDKSNEMIRSELVQQNYHIIYSGSKHFSANDCIIVRGYGKFIIDEIGPPTRKGRLRIIARRYG